MKYSQFSNGIGISDEDNSYFSRLINIDIHTKPGKAQCSLALEDIDGGGIVTSLPTCSMVASNGDTFIGAGTKIYKITGGTETLVHTSTQGAVLGLGEHQGYVYYSTATKLGRQTVSLASSEASWSSQNDSWATFTNAKAYKPMQWVNQILCIGDGNYIAIVDENGIFNANALDILERDVITALMDTNDNLTMGTFVNSAVHQANTYLWDTYSPSWSSSDLTQERGVNMFFRLDGYWYAQIGQIGNIYQWTGQRMLLYTRLRDGDSTVVTGINSYGTTSLNGLTLIATIRGVFSIGKADSRLGLAKVIEYVSSAGQGSTLGAIEAVGSDFYLGFNNGASYGIDHISSTYAEGIIETPLTYGKMKDLKIGYNSSPTGSTITAKIANDDGALTSHTMIKDDEDLREYRNVDGINCKSNTKAELTLTPNPSAPTSPIVINVIEIK